MYLIISIILAALCLPPVHLFAQERGEAQETNRLPGNLAPALENLLAFTEGRPDSRIDFGLIEEVFTFIGAPKNLGEAYSLGVRSGAVSDYYEFTLKRPLKEVLDLAFSPDIPSYLTNPSSVRRSHWVEIDGRAQPFPRLSRALEGLDGPLVVKGVEFMENTPDTTSGAYYAYELDRTFVLMKDRGRPLLISMSFQREKSDVGKIGLVLGSDDEWNYLYTGEKGTALPGLSWADSYMYTSASIVVYYEVLDPVPHVRCAVFKWLKAGWSGLNFVQPGHIRKGVERFAEAFKEIVESPALPEASRLSEIFRCIDGLSAEELKTKSRQYFDHLRSRYPAEKGLHGKWLARLSEDQNYLDHMKLEEMQALICVEHFKYLLGKSPASAWSALPASCLKKKV